jgi:hypothetical protein
MSLVQWCVGVLCAVVVVVLVVLLVRDRTPGRITTVLLGLIEVGLVVQLVVGVHRVLAHGEGVSAPTYIGYLVGALLIVPAGWFWSASERSRGATAVLLVAVLVIPVLFLRLHDIWSAHV